MKLAIRELLRRPGRFLSAGAILTLIAMLLMILGGLLDGLTRSSTGAIRAQDVGVIVYSDSARASFIRSRIDAPTRAAVEAADGVTEVGGIGVVQLGARLPDSGPRDLADVALFGYEIAPKGVPEPPADGEAWADEVLKADGVEEGMELLLGPERTPVTVVGFVSDTSYAGQGSLWATEATWREALTANRPDSQLAADVDQSLVVRGEGDAAELASVIDAATSGLTDSYTIPDAVAAIPGVEEQTSTFNQIIGVTVVIALVVIALFFALLTVERTALYGVLKALGARSTTIFGGLVLQAVAVTSGAVAIAGGLALLLDRVIPPGSIPLYITPSRIVSSAVLLLLAAVVGCGFSLRRVLRVDPASAIGTSS